jgi:hypothetical protein
VGWREFAGGLGTALAILGGCVPGALATSTRTRSRTTITGVTTTPPAARTLSLQAASSRLVSEHQVVLSGRATGEPAASVVRLYRSAYPDPAATLIRTTQTRSDGSFAFTVSPDRDARYRATLADGTASALVQVNVTGVALTKVKAISLGRARVRVVVFHPRDLRWGDARISWSFASGHRGGFKRGAVTRTSRLSPDVAVLGTTVTLPAGHFRWRACFHAPGDHALENPRRPPGCDGRGYHGGGSLPVGFPGPVAITRAERFLSGRIGRTALAVVDSEGRMSGVHVDQTFITGSVVKAMLLVAYLRRLDAMGRHSIDSSSNSFLYPMIHVSDNGAATRCWSIVGDSGLDAVARAAGMTNFSISGIWARAMISASDQARFFFEMDSLIPREFVGYARHLFSTIAAFESWGIPAVARPLGYTVFFKAGWRPSPDVYLVHQIARLEGHHRTFSMAVMTDGDPDMGYGIATIQGVTQALLR